MIHIFCSAHREEMGLDSGLSVSHVVIILFLNISLVTTTSQLTSNINIPLCSNATSCFCKARSVYCNRTYFSVDDLPRSTMDLTFSGLIKVVIGNGSFVVLKQLQTLTLINFSYLSFVNGSLFGLEKLKKLTVEGDRLYFKETGLLKFTPKLEYLYIECRYLRWEVLHKVLYELSGTNIKELVVNHISVFDVTVIGQEFYQILSSTNITSLSLTQANIAVILPGFYMSIPTLQHLDLTKNKIVGIAEALYGILGFHQNIITIDIGPQNICVDKNTHISFDYCSYGICAHQESSCPIRLPVAPKLQRVKLNVGIKGPLDYLCFNKNNSLKYLDFSDNIILDVTYSPIGFEQLQYFNLQNTELSSIPPTSAADMPMLETLLLGNNYLGNVIEKWVIAKESPFKLNEHLESLDLSNNGISDIGDILSKSNINCLNLSVNNLKTLPDNVMFLTNLRMLNVSYNQLTSLSTNLMEAYSEAAKVHDIELDLSGNPLTLSRPCCQIVDFIYWSKYTRVHLTRKETFVCYLSEKSTHFEDVMENECAQKQTVLIITCVVGMTALLCIFLGAVIHRYKWNVKWWLFLMRRYLKLKNEIRGNNAYTFDAFVAYNEEDFFWVRSKLMPFLEDKNQLKLCIHHRDFEVGVPVEENIVESIAKSRKTILVITNKFLRSTWCRFEVRMARERYFEENRDVNIPILMENIEMSNMTITMTNILSQNTYLEWSPEEEKQQIFWRQLLHVFQRSE